MTEGQRPVPVPFEHSFSYPVTLVDDDDHHVWPHAVLLMKEAVYTTSSGAYGFFDMGMMSTMRRNNSPIPEHFILHRTHRLYRLLALTQISLAE
ncbi:hypothetical protein [Paenibacillus taiwanensis]|uniref:hypothetical protein n=1 Tax=Paenibacillus taiwanensis TaxID=401638 RepID=UPI00048B6475|nr:hypothetical protein [Paenibacillus taiwanensis]